MSRWIPLLLAVSCLALPLSVASAQKHVVVDKSSQTLQAFEGPRLVFRSRVSTGRWDRSTPNGQFVAGEKSRMHYSRRYHNAPMPFSVHVTGNVFIHGFTYVPSWPDSHGCIRLPLDGNNPAKRFYEWVETGTSIEIVGHWQGRRLESLPPPRLGASQGKIRVVVDKPLLALRAVLDHIANARRSL